MHEFRSLFTGDFFFFLLFSIRMKLFLSKCKLFNLIKIYELTSSKFVLHFLSAPSWPRILFLLNIFCWQHLHGLRWYFFRESRRKYLSKKKFSWKVFLIKVVSQTVIRFNRAFLDAEIIFYRVPGELEKSWENLTKCLVVQRQVLKKTAFLILTDPWRDWHVFPTLRFPNSYQETLL